MSDRIRFAEFEVDPKSGELLRRGLRIELQNQPFQVLLLLLNNAGELVTREELRERLWRDDTFVDFDRGLNKAVHGIRRALRDRSDKPRFVETLSRRGYRFIGAVDKPLNGENGGTRMESVAVLPLENLSGDPAQDYFADAMTAELISGSPDSGARE